MTRLKVDKGAMFMAVTTHGFLYEPVFYWEDDRTVFHQRYLPEDYLKTLPQYPANPQGRALVREFNVYRWAGRMLLDAATMRRRGKITEHASGAVVPLRREAT